MAEKEVKKKTLAELTTSLRKTYGKIMPDPREAGTVKRLVLTDPGLNRIFGGGYPIGRITEFFGPESGGKTVLSHYIAADVQRQKERPPLVLYVDMEHTFEERYARNVGLEIDDPLKFLILRPLYGEMAFDICQQYVETGEVGMIIWDSVAATSTAAQAEDEYGKACVGPDTEIEFRVRSFQMRQTMRDLFIQAGYPNYQELEIDVPISPKTPIEILSWDGDSAHFVWKRVEALFYKGESFPNDTYEVMIPSKNKSFLCTGNHCLYERGWDLFLPVRKLYERRGMKHISIDNKGEIIEIMIHPMIESFSVLDVQVEGTSCYFSAGILSHNSFGGTAKLFSEGLRKFNPYLSHYDTSLHLINQLRDDIGAKAMPGMPKPEKTTGGRAIKFYASWRGRVSQTEPIMHLGEQIGNKIRVKNQKNKVGIPKRSTEMELLYSSGFNPDRAYIDFITKLEIVNVKGSYYSSEEFGITKTLHGQDQLFNWFIGHQDAFEVAKARVNESFTHYNASLDAEDAVPDLVTEMEAESVAGLGSEE